ncbi:MAG: TatD family hydrolase [Alloprevotella sp.]|nr:TatD family hydrolase [Alloprevotella sp.]
MNDFHTHNLDALPGKAIINLPAEALLHPDSFTFRPGCLYSAGIHPWWTDAAENIPGFIEGLRRIAAHPQVVAIGECGFDRLRGDLRLQEEIFPLHIEIAEAHQKPVTLHCVRAFDLLLAARKRLQPTTQWTVHGFRGKPSLARQLLEAGLDLSFGQHYNAESFEITPPQRRHRETDDGHNPI